jgi:predicted unusual protein kinase regulating ubiquinone biosynthesis (AarF/ABC1/UbiB family)
VSRRLSTSPILNAEFSSTRVLTMGFEEGSYVTNQAAIQQLGLNKMDVSSIVAKIFCEQM